MIMVKKMKLSIITINRNDEQGLLKTIQSVSAQTCKDFEFIVIDGASTDNSIDVIRNNEDIVSFWISEPDSGIYNAMNKGIKKATGDYLYFLNAGDVLVNNDVVSNVLKHTLSEPFVCGNIIWDRKGVLTEDKCYKDRDWTFSLYDLYSGFLSHQAFFISRNMFDKYGFYDERFRIMSDWKHFFIAIGINRESVQYIDVTISIYNTGGLSSTIGGAAILKEKQQIAKEELSSSVFEEIDRLYMLSRNGFWVDFILCRKWVHFLSKVFLKFCILARVYKP